MKPPVPTRVRTDVVTRCIIERHRTTLAEIMGRMMHTHATDVEFTVRGDAPRPIFDITTHHGGPATLVSGGEWLDRTCKGEIMATQVEDGELSPPCIRLFTEIPDTTMTAAIGRPLSDVVDCRLLEGMRHAIVTGVFINEYGMLEMALEPDWRVHDARDGWTTGTQA